MQVDQSQNYQQFANAGGVGTTDTVDLNMDYAYGPSCRSPRVGSSIPRNKRP